MMEFLLVVGIVVQGQAIVEFELTLHVCVCVLAVSYILKSPEHHTGTSGTA